MSKDRSRLDPNQITQCVYNSQSESFDVTIIDTEMNMSLSADEGDSIQVESKSLNQKVELNEEFNIENIDKLRIYVKSSVGCQVSLQVSPDGENWYSMWDYDCHGNHMSQCIENVMAKKARIVADAPCELIVCGKGN